MYKTDNLLFPSVYRKFQNDRVSGRQPLYFDNFVKIDFGLTCDFTHLELQATVFARELLSKTHIDFRRVFSRTRPEKFEEMAWQMYIYSYCKCLLTGLNFNSIRTLPDKSFCFVGHGILFKMICRNSFCISKNEFSLYMNINISNEESIALQKQILERYPFISDGTGAGPFNTYLVKNYFIENMFSQLLDSVNLTTENVINQTQEFDFTSQPFSSSKMVDEQSVVLKDKVSVDSNLNNNPVKGNPVAVKKGMRLVEIYSMDDPYLDSFLTDSQNPLGSSAIDITSKDKWYYVFNNDKSILNSITYHLCKANFIYLQPNLSNNMCGEFSVYLDSLRRNYSQDWSVNRDVRAITYLYCNQPINESDLNYSNKFLSPKTPKPDSIFDVKLGFDDRNLDAVDSRVLSDSIATKDDGVYKLETSNVVKVVGKIAKQALKDLADSELTYKNLYDIVDLTQAEDLFNNLSNYRLVLEKQGPFSTIRKLSGELDHEQFRNRVTAVPILSALLDRGKKVFFDRSNFKCFDSSQKIWFTNDNRLGLEIRDANLNELDIARIMTLQILRFHDLIDDSIFAKEFSEVVIPNRFEFSINHKPGRFLISRVTSRVT